MIKGFLPSNEKARAELKLMTLKMHRNIHKHIDEFADFIEFVKSPLGRLTPLSL